MQSGLYIVGTPIGNLSDMSPRAIETLQNADLICVEDTRVFGKLASHFNIKSKTIAIHEHNERDAAALIIEKITNGAAVAMVSDSGMPAISDPGFILIRTARAANIPVFIVPGPTAFSSALILSGFPTDRFTFCGFFRDEKHLSIDNKIRHTIIYYESPNRIADTIALCAKIMPERRVAIVREITKIHEETIIGYPADLLPLPTLRGEIVLVIEPAPDVKITDDEISEIVRDVLSRGMSSRDAANEISDRTGLNKSDAYKLTLTTDTNRYD